MSKPLGRFTVRAVGSAIGVGNKLALHVEILNEGEHEGRRVSFVGNLDHDVGFEVTIKALKAVGWEGDMISDFFDLDESKIIAIAPAEAEAQISERFYVDEKGAEKSTLDVKIFPLGGSVFAFKETLDARQAAALGAQLKNRIRALGIPASKPVVDRRSDAQQAEAKANASAPAPRTGGQYNTPRPQQTNDQCTRQEAAAGRAAPRQQPHPNAPGNDPDWMHQ